MEVSGQFHAPSAFFPEKNPYYSSNSWLGGPQSRSERGGAGNRTPLVKPVAQSDPSRVFIQHCVRISR